MQTERIRAAELVSLLADEYEAGTISPYDMTSYISALVVLGQPESRRPRAGSDRARLFQTSDLKKMAGEMFAIGFMIVCVVAVVTMSYLVVLLVSGIVNMVL